MSAKPSTIRTNPIHESNVCRHLSLLTSVRSWEEFLSNTVAVSVTWSRLRRGDPPQRLESRMTIRPRSIAMSALPLEPLKHTAHDLAGAPEFAGDRLMRRLDDPALSRARSVRASRSGTARNSTSCMVTTSSATRFA